MEKTMLHKYNRNGYIVSLWACLSISGDIVIHYEITAPNLVRQCGHEIVHLRESTYEIYSDLAPMPSYIENFALTKVKTWAQIIYDYGKGQKYKGHRLCSHEFLLNLYQKWSVYDERYDLNR